MSMIQRLTRIAAPSRLASLAKQQIKLGIELFKADSLFRNAVYLMLSTGIMSVLGFGFWIFLSRLYTPGEIGVAAALISITALIANLCFFGINAGIVRFLPTSKNRSGDINAALITVSMASMLAALIYLFWVGDDLTGKLAFFNATAWGRALFVALIAAVSLNTFTDSIFIASRRAEFHTIVYACFGLVKLLLPIFLIPLGSLGIFAAYCAAVTVSLVLSIVFMWRSCGYHPFSRPNWSFIRSSGKYTTNNYVASLLSGLPSQVMPTLVLIRLGDASAAYFTLAWTMASLLFVVPAAITKSLLAEGSHDASKRSQNLKSAIKLLSVILVPVVVLSIVLAPYLLKIFGQQYSTASTTLFQLLALCTFCLAGNAIGDTVMNLEHRSRGIVLVQAVMATVMLVSAWFLVRFGLVGVGVSILMAYLAGNAVQLALLTRRKLRKRGDGTSAPTKAVIGQLLALYGLKSAQVGDDMGGGDRSSTVRVTSGKLNYVFKVFNSQKRTADQLCEEIRFTQFLSRKGISSPQVLPASQGELISELSADGETWLGMLMSFEAGQQPHEYTPALLAAMARAQGVIHVSGVEYANLLGERTVAVKGRSFLSSVLRFAPRGLSHFDFYGSNILVNGDTFSCALDFEGMRYDPLVVCLLFTLMRLYSDSTDRSKLVLYLQAYQGVRALNRLEKIIIHTGLMVRFRSPKLLTLRY